MDELISRQAAIDALEEPPKVPDTWSDESAIGEREQWEKDVKALNSLPPAQPEITLESAIDFLHKIGWLQEHDRIMSEQKKGKWIFVNKFRGQHKCSVCGVVAVQARNGFHLESSPTDNTGEHAIVIDHYKEFLSDYCPNCGAEMQKVNL